MKRRGFFTKLLLGAIATPVVVKAVAVETPKPSLVVPQITNSPLEGGIIHHYLPGVYDSNTAVTGTHTITTTTTASTDNIWINMSETS